jgi:hypothetical protein
MEDVDFAGDALDARCSQSVPRFIQRWSRQKNMLYLDRGHKWGLRGAAVRGGDSDQGDIATILKGPSHTDRRDGGPAGNAMPALFERVRDAQSP